MVEEQPHTDETYGDWVHTSTRITLYALGGARPHAMPRVVNLDLRQYKIPCMKFDEGTGAQRAVFRAMTPEQKLRAAFRLYWSARQLKEASLRTFHPELSEVQIKARVRECFMYARD